MAKKAIKMMPGRQSKWDKVVIGNKKSSKKDAKKTEKEIVPPVGSLKKNAKKK